MNELLNAVLTNPESRNEEAVRKAALADASVMDPWVN